MTIQESLEIIKNEMPYESGVINEALNMVENAVEKQIPCKLAPKSSKKSEVPVCGKCNSIMDLMQGELNYCPNCGQKIDWSNL